MAHNGFMAVPLFSPSALVELSRYAIGQVVETAAAVATIPVRVLSLVGQAELIVSKQRNGPTGTVPLYFHKAYTRFDSVAHNERDGAGAQQQS